MSNESIRYAGKVGVRGMIRRVWRTRFIEIDSAGVLRYYETSEESEKEDSPAKIHSRVHEDDTQSLRGSTSSGETPRRNHSNRRSSLSRKHKRTISPEMQAFSLPLLYHSSINPEDDDEDYIRADCSLSQTDQKRSDDSDGLKAAGFPFDSDDASTHKEGIVVTNHAYADSKRMNPIEDNWDHLRSDSSGDISHNAGSDTITSMDDVSHDSVQGVQDIHNLVRSQSHHIHGHRPKATILVRSARLLDPNSLRDMHLGLPKGKHGFMFHGCSIFSAANLDIQSHSSDTMCQSRFHFDDISDMSRDYLCAVSSLSEAENWVKELSWASTTCREYERTLRERYIEMDEDNKFSDSSHHMGVFQNLRSHNRKNLIGDLNTEDRSLFMGSSQSLDSVDTFGSVMIHNDKQTMDSSNPIIVIPKVRKIHYIPKRKRLFGVKLDIQVEIQVLVTKSFPSSENIYQYTIFRSYSDIETFFASLDGIKLTKLSPLKNDIKFKLTSSIDRDSLIITDLNSKLREVVSNRTVCNSEKVKDFLLLTHNLKNSLLPTVSKHGETFTRLPDNQTLDDFVKKWVSYAPSKSKTRETFQDIKILIYLLLQDVRVEFILTLLLVYEIFRISYWWWYMRVISVTVRLDCFLLMYVGSCYYAFVMGDWSARVTLDKDRNIQSSYKEPMDTASSADIVSIGDTTNRVSDSAISLQSSQQSGSAAHSIWTKPDDSMFKVRGPTYLKDRTKIPSHKAPFECLAVDIYLTDNPERNIARHDFVFGGNAPQEDVLVVNFLLPFANFIAIFRVPPLTDLAPHVAGLWTRFVQGDQQYRDSRLKLLSVVVEGPWIVKKAVGHGSAPALLGKVIPLQYFFSNETPTRNYARYEIDIIITASRIANGILNVVKGHTKNMSIAFAFIIEGVTAEELPETVLCSFQLNSVHLEKCPQLPDHDIMESDYE